MEVYGLHRLLCGLLGGKARPFMTSGPARLLGLFQVSERLLQPIRRAIGHVRPLLTGYYTLSSLLLHLVLRIERKTGTSGTFAQIATIGANVTSYIDSGLTSGSIFCYRLLAYNVAGDSAYSNEACGTTPQDFSLTVVRAGTGCSEPYPNGTAVTLTATPAAGSTFGGWSGGGCTGTGSCTVTMTAARTVTATFNLQNFTLTVTKAGTGSGTVASMPAGISCGTDCSEPYPNGTAVTLTATPAAGAVFGGWSGGCTGIGSCTVTMTVARSVTATFNVQTFTLTVTKAGTGSGTVASTPAGISCGTDCSQPYASGTAVTLTPTSAAGAVFGGWSGGG